MNERMTQRQARSSTLVESFPCYILKINILYSRAKVKLTSITQENRKEDTKLER